MATSKLLLSALARAYALSETRTRDDPDYQEALEEIRDVQGEVGWMVVRVRRDGISIGSEVVSDLYGDVAGLHSALEEAGIRELRFQGVLESSSLDDFLRRLRPGFEERGALASQRFRGLDPELGLSFRSDGGDLPGMAGGVQGLFRERGPSVASDRVEADDVGLTADPGHEADDVGLTAEPGVELDDVGFTPDPGDGDEVAAGLPEEGDPAFPRFRPPLPQEVIQELETYASSYDLLKRESEDRLRNHAEALRAAKDHATLVELVSVLAEGGVGERVESEAVRLAGDLTSPTVASLLVARLGATRDGTERSRLAVVLARIGREGAAALADALGESRNRSERRAFLDAMVTLGPLAFEMAQGMVDDPRWFVVRNGVTVLGELGGAEAVESLTGTLANEDPRVRKESISALAKIGGPNAEALVQGMLDDPVPEVRGAACRGLGVLGSTRALHSLLDRLKDSSADVQVEALQALGRIGDPGAVQAVRKIAVGGFFSRPPQPVRLAAYQALAAIGTPGALQVLAKGTTDGDEAVRTLARSLVSRK